MAKFAIALTLVLSSTPASAGPIWNCARHLLPLRARAYGDLQMWKLDSKPYFFKQLWKLRRQRQRYGISPVRDLAKVPPGRIVLITATNCGPSIETTMRLNILRDRFPGWTFNAHDYKQNWHSDDGQISSILVVGHARRVQFLIGGWGQSIPFAKRQLAEALVLSAEPGPDLVWAVRTPRTGRWVEARTNPARDAHAEMDADSFQ